MIPGHSAILADRIRKQSLGDKGDTDEADEDVDEALDCKKVLWPPNSVSAFLDLARSISYLYRKSSLLVLECVNGL